MGLPKTTETHSTDDLSQYLTKRDRPKPKTVTLGDYLNSEQKHIGKNKWKHYLC